MVCMMCCNDPKFTDRQSWAIISLLLKGLHCSSFCLHLLDALLYVKTP